MRFVILLVVVAVAVVLWRQAQARRRPFEERGRAARAPTRGRPSSSPAGSDPGAIAPGDVVSYGGADHLVVGSLLFDQDGFTWQEHHLDDASTRRWLSVEDDDELELVLWSAVLAPELAPGPASLVHAGVAYALAEHGRATFTAVGSTGTAPAGEVEYYDYENGDQRLSFERYGPSSDWAVATGTVVPTGAVDVFHRPPGDA